MKKRLLSLLTAGALAVGLVGPASAAVFQDMRDFGWAVPYAEDLAERGILKGRAPGQFAPAEMITAAEVLACCSRLLGLEEENKQAIQARRGAEVARLLPETCAWAAPEAAICLEAGIITRAELEQLCKTDGINKPMAKENLVMLIVRAMGLETAARELEDLTLPYTDAALVAEDRLCYVRMLSDLGVITGTDTNEFQPKSFVNRAVIAAALSRAVEKMEEQRSAADLPEYVNEFTRAVAGVNADTVMFTVDGMDVAAEYYFYWLAYYCYQIDLQYQMYQGLPLDFDLEISEGVTAASYLKDQARQMATAYLKLEQEAPARGADVTAEQQAELDAQTAAYIEEQGREAYETLLHQSGISEQLFDRLSRTTYLIQNLQDSFPAPTREEADQYIKDNDLLRCKHILIRTAMQKEDGTVGYNREGTPTNEDGSAYTGTVEEYNAAALEKANAILAQLNAAEDPLALFDRLMQENSEDPGLATFPDGYDFTAGQMIPEFEQGTRALEYNQYSARPVQSDDGYHIILRLRPEVDDAFRQQQFNRLMEAWSSLDFTPTPAYEALDVKDFYEKYTAYQAPFLEEAAQDTGSGIPIESPSRAAEG